ncbi:MAG: hypothetical protein AB7E77_02225 [Desulfobulbus sp.]
MHWQKQDEKIDRQAMDCGQRTGCPLIAPAIPPKPEALPASSPMTLESEKLKLVGSLAGSLAHNFNNPLCGVHSVLERLARRIDLPDAEKHLLQLALQQCDRMKVLLQDLQGFLHASPHERTRFDLFAAIAAVLRLMHKQLKHSRIIVSFPDTQKPVMLEGNEGQIKQMLLHLFAVVCRRLAALQCTITLNAVEEEEGARLIWRFQVPEAATDRLEQLLAGLMQPNPNPVLDTDVAMAHSILSRHGGTMRQTGTVGGCGELVLSFQQKKTH